MKIRLFGRLVCNLDLYRVASALVSSTLMTTVLVAVLGAVALVSSLLRPTTTPMILIAVLALWFMEFFIYYKEKEDDNT